MKLQKKVQELTALLGSRDDLAEELRVKDSLLRKLQERVQHLKEACEAGSRELQRCKAENYDLALRLARQSEERDAALTGHRGLLLEVPRAGGGGRCGAGPRPRPTLTATPHSPQIDRLKHSLMKAEDDCRVERKHTLKLRRAMELRPSQELLWELQQEKALLQARVQGLEASVQVGPWGWRRRARREPGPCPPTLFPRTHRRGSRTRAAPTSRCRRRTGSGRSGTSSSRPPPSSPCAGTCARPRPYALG